MFRTRTMLRPVLVAAILLLVLTASCSRKSVGESKDVVKVRLSDQYGLAYAPVAAARLQGWFEEECPSAEFQWNTMGNTTAIREAILADRLDGGFMGIPPYLIGRDRGMEWSAYAAVSEADLGLTTTRAGIETIADIPADLRIALPQPGSIQHILLAMAAHRELGNAEIFDDQLVTLKHPDGMNALLTGGEIEAHFTSPPFLQRELEAGARLLVDGDDAFGGDYTFIVAVLSDAFIEANPEVTAGIRRGIQRGAAWIEENPGEAAALLAEHFRMEEAELKDFFLSDTLDFGGTVKGTERFRSFMTDRGYLKTGLVDEILVVE